MKVTSAQQQGTVIQRDELGETVTLNTHLGIIRGTDGFEYHFRVGDLFRNRTEARLGATVWFEPSVDGFVQYVSDTFVPVKADE